MKQGWTLIIKLHNKVNKFIDQTSEKYETLFYNDVDWYSSVTNLYYLGIISLQNPFIRTYIYNSKVPMQVVHLYNWTLQWFKSLLFL